jgi:hypothetical protein
VNESSAQDGRSHRPSIGAELRALAGDLLRRLPDGFRASPEQCHLARVAIERRLLSIAKELEGGDV